MLYAAYCVQEGAFALAFKSVHFPGEIVVARYAALYVIEIHTAVAYICLSYC